MNSITIDFAIAVVVSFAAGVIFHRYVIAEATDVKQHVSDELASLRAYMTNLLTAARKI